MHALRQCIIFFLYTLFFISASFAQQYNSDSWISKPHGMVTLIPTLGERNSMIMNTYSLLPNWEFTMAIYLYNNDGDISTNDGNSTSIYAKYMFYQNKAETGGAAIKFGTGMRPGTLSADLRVRDAFRTYWINMPVTIPFFKNTLSWDIMPGASYTIDNGTIENPGWSFTYSTRLAYYPFGPKASIVGEIFGSEGQNGTLPEYKLGIRWEPNQYAVFAITYGQEFKGKNGAGFEIGGMFFTPPFLCLGGCDKVKKKPAM